jgi:hypothetical protein
MLIIADGAVIEKNNESYVEWGMKSNEVEEIEGLKEIELKIIEELKNK